MGTKWINIYTGILRYDTKHKVQKSVSAKRQYQENGDTQWKETTMGADNPHMYETPNTCTETRKRPNCQYKTHNDTCEHISSLLILPYKAIKNS